jgi:lantibiotic biosynthesis protein
MWQSVLTSPLRAAVHKVARALVDDLLRTPPEEVSDPWSAAQCALVAWEHGRLTNDPRHRGAAEAFADRAAELSASATMEARFIKGFVGVGWLFEVMQDAPDDADADGDLDDAVGALARRDPWPGVGYFDLVSGLVGAGVYFLGRPSSPRITAHLEEIVYRLEESAEYLPDGIAWWGATVLGPQQVVSCFNLGLAHGVPGIVGFLARALSRGISPRRTHALLEGAVRWILAQRLAAGPSCFPTYCTPSGPDGPARAAWCYGDPGVALALMAAASAADRRDWEAAAIDVALVAARRPAETTLVQDASVCHGAAGLLHVFNRLYQASGEGQLREAAARWAEATLALLAQDRWDGVPGSAAPLVSKRASVLEGQAGIALALLSATSERAPLWDAMLLSDVVPGPSARAKVVA